MTRRPGERRRSRAAVGSVLPAVPRQALLQALLQSLPPSLLPSLPQAPLPALPPPRRLAAPPLTPALSLLLPLLY